MKVCGLNGLQIDLMGEKLEEVAHAVLEEDWDRLSLEGGKAALKTIKDGAWIMNNAKCTCMPHGFTDPNELASLLEGCVKNKVQKCSLDALLGLSLCIVSDTGCKGGKII